ncbi:MAG: dihydroneopterin aldolase family protein [Candidatus Nezhaarchaeota archaeon]|nr:dihydroneopterin aldolase family protein [Candidatus Nezhaarchaeota archaeon]MCX8141269.1 dihydroneopterin aldolase family protein [Candidatus Nezhaarchaeota archaeon]MDW8049535.1 dihydroneopterin aldolase family protein [Nitrososphaerota archaeon]
MERSEDPARKLFHPSITDRERAIFEAGIALGALYHQFVGIPIARREEVLKAIKDAIEKVMALQPFREKVEVNFNLDAIKGQLQGPYDYSLLRGEAIDVKVTVRYGSAKVRARMRFVEELGFNLMYIEDVEGYGAKQG